MKYVASGNRETQGKRNINLAQERYLSWKQVKTPKEMENWSNKPKESMISNHRERGGTIRYLNPWFLAIGEAAKPFCSAARPVRPSSDGAALRLGCGSGLCFLLLGPPIPQGSHFDPKILGNV